MPSRHPRPPRLNRRPPRSIAYDLAELADFKQHIEAEIQEKSKDLVRIQGEISYLKRRLKELDRKTQKPQRRKVSRKKTKRAR